METEPENVDHSRPGFQGYSPPSVWPLLFRGAGHEKRRGEQHLVCTLEVFHSSWLPWGGLPRLSSGLMRGVATLPQGNQELSC